MHPQSPTPAVDLRASDIHIALYIKWWRTSAPAVLHSRSGKKEYLMGVEHLLPQSLLFRYANIYRLQDCRSSIKTRIKVDGYSEVWPGNVHVQSLNFQCCFVIKVAVEFRQSNRQ